MNNNRKVSTFSPFITYCQYVIPLAYDESMSYYETLCALRNYLVNTVIPAVNNNADAVTELQDKYIEFTNNINNTVEELENYIDNYFNNLDVQTEINNKLDQMAEDGTLARLIYTIRSLRNFPYMEDIILNDNDITLGTGWNGNLNDGFTHTPGNDEPLTINVPHDIGDIIYISFNVDPETIDPIPQSTFSIKIGNTDEFNTYLSGNFKQFGIKTIDNGNIIITPDSLFNQRIYNIFISKEINVMPEITKTNDAYNNITNEYRTSYSDYNSIYIGKNSGQHSMNADYNTSVGNNSLSNNTTGFWNTAIGGKSLEKNTVGTRNCAIGYLALNENIVGDRNYAIGTYALLRNRKGRNNIAIGADCSWSNDGNNNVVIGSASFAETTLSNNNVVIGQDSMSYATTGDGNVYIGYLACGKGTGSNNCVGIGQQVLYRNSGNNNNAIGYTSLNNNTTGHDNTALGDSTLTKNITGSGNTAIGSYSGNQSTGSNNTLLGYRTGLNITGNNNIILGSEAGNNLTTGNNNIILGRYAEVNANNTNNELNIGNLIKGDLIHKRIGINKDPFQNGNTAILGGQLEIGASDGSVSSVPIKLNAGKLVGKPENGSIEYDGTNLYFTTGASRKKITLSDV